MHTVRTKRLNKLIRLCAITFAGLTISLVTHASVAKAQSHSYINLMRSSTESHYFIQQSIDGEFGRYQMSFLGQDDSGNEQASSAKEYWKGYGIGTTLGVELLKFVQVVGGHTFMNLRHQNDSLESLNGSRLNAGLRLVFLAPVANLEAGAGLQGSRLDYRKDMETAGLYGSGVYYSLGLNYFISSHVSFYYEAKMVKEHMVKSSGSSELRSIDADTTTMGLGFRIWM